MKPFLTPPGPSSVAFIFSDKFTSRHATSIAFGHPILLYLLFDNDQPETGSRVTPSCPFLNASTPAPSATKLTRSALDRHCFTSSFFLPLESSSSSTIIYFF